MLGVSLGSGTLRALVALKLGLLCFLIFWGLLMGRGDWSNLTPFWIQRPGSDALMPAIGIALVGAFIAYAGWWDVSKLAGEVSDPERTLPRAPYSRGFDRHGRLHHGQRGIPLPGAACSAHSR